MALSLRESHRVAGNHEKTVVHSQQIIDGNLVQQQHPGFDPKELALTAETQRSTHPGPASLWYRPRAIHRHRSRNTSLVAANQSASLHHSAWPVSCTKRSSTWQSSEKSMLSLPSARPQHCTCRSRRWEWWCQKLWMHWPHAPHAARYTADGSDSMKSKFTRKCKEPMTSKTTCGGISLRRCQCWGPQRTWSC